MSKKNPLFLEAVFAVIFIVGIFLALSLFGLCGIVGRAVSSLLFGLFGVMAYIFPILLVLFGGLFIFNSDIPKYRRKAWYGLGMYIVICGIVQWFFNGDVENIWSTYTHAASYHTRGGFFGGLLSYELGKLLGRVGDLIFLIGVLLVLFILFSRKLIFTNINKNARKKISNRTENTYIYEGDERDPMDVPKITGTEDEDKKKAPKKKKEMKKTAVLEPVTPKLPESDEEKKLKDVHINGLNRPGTGGDIAEREMEAKFGKKSEKKEIAEEKTEKAEKAEKAPDFDPPEEFYGPATNITPVDTGGASDVDEIGKEASKNTAKEIPYTFPSLDLLTRKKSGAKTMSEKDLKETALKLQETLESFGVGVKLGDISVGPSVTRYELIPDQGVKVSRITSLGDDIKLALAASDIRIEAPIPGKSAVGIEVPNPTRVTITLRELLESDEFKEAKSKVTFAVGKDISGKTVVTDIAKMPHLLVAGSTGSGKSVLINTLIMSIIYKASPNEVKLIMVDPKMVEFMAYQEIPHLMIPVVEDPKKASAALAWAVAEMEKRYKKFSELRMRDIVSYNAKVEKMKNPDPEFVKMPQIVIIVDEFADLMMVASKDVEDSVCRLAQKARAAGIHLVLATQRPSVNVITGLIKANIPSRIALSVSSQIDSRTIIDSAGAEKLLGNGDMLFAPVTLPEPIRVQGAFVSDDDRDKVVSFLKDTAGSAYDSTVIESIESVQSSSYASETGETNLADDRDDYFEEAGRFIIEKQKASIGNLQRVFRIGFNRAARIMDQLCDAGVVGPEEGTKARQILMSMEEFDAYLQNN